MTDKKWYKIAKKIVDILAYILAAIGGFSLMESCTMPRDNSVGEVRVVVIKDNNVPRETSEVPEYELPEVEIEDVSDYVREDVR